MAKITLSDQLITAVQSCIGEDTDIPTSAASLASCAMKQLDPDNSAPLLVSFGCNMELRQIARNLLRRTYDPMAEEQENNQVEMFETLQDKYPAHRNGHKFYVPRMQLTLDERMFNIERMKKEIASKQKHVDALMAETISLMEQGYFEKTSGQVT